MKLKYYLRGMGIGMILTTLILTFSFSQNKMSDEEIIRRAEVLGMVMKEEPLFSKESEKGETETQVTETQETEIQTTETTKNSEQPQETESLPNSQEEPDTPSVPESYHLVIQEGAVPKTICKELEEKGVIASASEMIQCLVDMSYETFIIVGEYEIPYGASYQEIYEIFKAGPY